MNIRYIVFCYTFNECIIFKIHQKAHKIIVQLRKIIAYLAVKRFFSETELQEAIREKSSR